MSLAVVAFPATIMPEMIVARAILQEGILVPISPIACNLEGILPPAAT